MFTRFAVADAATRPTSMTGATAATMCMSRPATEPAVQNRMSLRLCVLVSTMPLVSAEHTAPSADPPSTTVIGVDPRLRALSAKTSTTAIVAPRKPTPTATSTGSEPNTAVAAATASAAPGAMPIRFVSASGLRVCPWSRAPAVPSAEPASRPSSVRGTRSWATTCASSLTCPDSAWNARASPSRTALTLSATLICRAPTASESNTAATAEIPSAMANPACLVALMVCHRQYPMNEMCSRGNPASVTNRRRIAFTEVFLPAIQ